MKVFELLNSFMSYRKGTKLYEYTGCTYGVVSGKGLAVTEYPNELPFFEVPLNMLKHVGEHKPREVS